MLPAPSRLRRTSDFRAAVRGGRRAGAGRLVAHLHRTGDAPATRAGFVVSRAVGPAVVRNRVRRRLRHLVAERLHRLPPGSAFVVRALPPTAGSTAADLARDLDRVLDRLLSTAGPSARVDAPC